MHLRMSRENVNENSCSRLGVLTDMNEDEKKNRSDGTNWFSSRSRVKVRPKAST